MLAGFSVIGFRGVSQPQKLLDLKALRSLADKLFESASGVSELSRVIRGGRSLELAIKRLALSETRQIGKTDKHGSGNNRHEPESEDHSNRMLALCGAICRYQRKHKTSESARHGTPSDPEG
jgi:hypothetical protein